MFEMNAGFMVLYLSSHGKHQKT